jgi:hypothetical protein
MLLRTLQSSSISGMAELTVRQARELLAEWAEVVASRDNRIRTAHAAGLTKSEISRLTGVARTTVDRILGGREGSDGEH